MNRNALLALAVGLIASLSTSGSAQTKMNVRPESKVTLEGGSNIHDWACNSSTFDATIVLDSNYQAQPLTAVVKPIAKVAVTIPVRSLKCGHAKMDDNMYKALRADDFPDIKYVLATYEVNKEASTADSLVARTVGNLTIAGTTQKVEIGVTAVRLDGGSMRGEGTAKMLMTDFGVTPPSALFGTIRTKNEITIKFAVLLDKTVVVALTQP